MYGTRDAQAWQDHYTEHLCARGFCRGVASRTLFYNVGRSIRLLLDVGEFSLIAGQGGVDSLRFQGHRSTWCGFCRR